MKTSRALIRGGCVALTLTLVLWGTVQPSFALRPIDDPDDPGDGGGGGYTPTPTPAPAPTPAAPDTSDLAIVGKPVSKGGGSLSNGTGNNAGVPGGYCNSGVGYFETYQYGTSYQVTDNGLLAYGGFYAHLDGRGRDVWQFAYVDLNELTLNKGGYPYPPPVGSISIDRAAGGAGGIKLFWSVTQQN